MDLRLYGNVLWRHRFVVLGGAVLAVLLAILSFYRVQLDNGVPKLTPRKAEVWGSTATIFITEPGFPAGRRVAKTPQYSSPDAFAGLAGLYARLATSDSVLQRMRAAGPVKGTFQASPVLDSTGRSPQPLINLIGQAGSPRDARETVEHAITAFFAYIRAQQIAARIPKSQRVELSVVNAPRPAGLLVGRKRTLPIVVFLSVLIAAIALAFILENSRRSATVTDLKVEPESVAGTVDEPEPEPSQSVRRWA